MYGLCLSDPHPDRAGDGSPIRTLSAARFGGRYRLVDFVLSNMVNSKIYSIGMVLNSHYQSLIDHIGMGKDWDLARKSGGVRFFPPYLADERKSVNSEIDGPLQRAADYIAEAKVEHIVLADSSIVYNIDYRLAVEAHKRYGADITAIYTKKQIGPGEREASVVFDISESGRVENVNIGQYTTENQNISLGAYILSRKLFIQLTAGEKNCGMQRFSRTLVANAVDRFRVMGYEFKGYTAHINSVETFYNHNMDMLDSEKRNSLFDFEGRRILTNRRDSLPARYGRNAEVKNSLVADGCLIDGFVENRIICRNVKIAPGAVVKNCIIQDDAVVEKSAALDCVITDRFVTVSENRSMMGSRTYPIYIDRNRVV